MRHGRRSGTTSSSRTSGGGALRNMVDCVLDDAEPAISAADGLRVVAMIEAAECSIEQRQPVQISSLLDESGE